MGDISSDADVLVKLVQYLDYSFSNQECADQFAADMGFIDDIEVMLRLRRIAARLRALDER